MLVYIAKPRYSKEMVNRCMAAGCSNTPSDRVSLVLKVTQRWRFKMHMGKASTADSSSVESYQTLSSLVVTILLRTCFEGDGLPWWSGMEGFVV